MYAVLCVVTFIIKADIKLQVCQGQGLTEPVSRKSWPKNSIRVHCDCLLIMMSNDTVASSG